MPISMGPNLEKQRVIALQSMATSLERIAKCLEDKNQ